MADETKDVEEEVKAEGGKKKPFIAEAKLEMLIAIFLGITALLTAWATWIGSLHGGNQATNYTKSNNASSEGNSMYNEAFQNLLQDMMTWNLISEYQFDKDLAEAKGEELEVQMIESKIQTVIADNCEGAFYDAVQWAIEDPTRNPFDKEGLIDSYYADAQAKLQEADDLLKEGMQDNKNGDTYNLVTVIFSLVLFLLGIVGIFKNIPNRFIVFVVAVVLLIGATIYMCTIPMPTGFDLFSYFKG